MKIVSLYVVSLVVGALVAGGPVSAAPADEQKFNQFQTDAFREIDGWEASMKKAFDATRDHKGYLSEMQAASEKLRIFLTDKPCRDGKQATEIEKRIHTNFHHLYGRIVEDIVHAVDLNCRNNKLGVTMRITEFKATAAGVAQEKGIGEMAKINQDIHAEQDKSTREITAATKSIFDGWIANIRSITGGDKNLESVRAKLTRSWADIAPSLKQVPCYDNVAAREGTKASVAGAQSALFQKVTLFKVNVVCTGKKLDVTFGFDTMRMLAS